MRLRVVALLVALLVLPAALCGTTRAQPVTRPAPQRFVPPATVGLRPHEQPRAALEREASSLSIHLPAQGVAVYDRVSGSVVAYTLDFTDGLLRTEPERTSTMALTRAELAYAWELMERAWREEPAGGEMADVERRNDLFLVDGDEGFRVTERGPLVDRRWGSALTTLLEVAAVRHDTTNSAKGALRSSPRGELPSGAGVPTHGIVLRMGNQHRESSVVVDFDAASIRLVEESSHAGKSPRRKDTPGTLTPAARAYLIELAEALRRSPPIAELPNPAERRDLYILDGDTGFHAGAGALALAKPFPAEVAAMVWNIACAR